MQCKRNNIGIGILFVLALIVPVGVSAVTSTGTISISAEVLSSVSSTPVSGGGGGGGGGITTSTTVTFSGMAYPLSKVTILKDGMVALTTIAGSDAKFRATLSDLSTGNYYFSVYAEDSTNARSNNFSFPLSLTRETATDITGIFITPTLSLNQSQVKKGDTVTFFGKSAPHSEVSLLTHSATEIFTKVTADKAGSYLYQLDTTPLELGTHTTKAKASKDAFVSEYSPMVSFVVGSVNLPQVTSCGVPGSPDVNCDTRINLTDFSMMAFWYKKSNPPKKMDMNNDGKITLIDFSILAYHWTG